MIDRRTDVAMSWAAAGQAGAQRPPSQGRRCGWAPTARRDHRRQRPRPRQSAAGQLPGQGPEGRLCALGAGGAVSADQRTDVAIELTPLPGTLALSSRVAGAEVWVGP